MVKTRPQPRFGAKQKFKLGTSAIGFFDALLLVPFVFRRIDRSRQLF